MTRQIVSIAITLIFTLQAAVAEGPADIFNKLAGKDPKMAIIEAREILKGLRASDVDQDGGALASAVMQTGLIASKAGEHQEAVELLLEGLPVIAEMREGELLLSEYLGRLSLLNSLKELGRFNEAIEHLNTLVERTKKGIELRVKMGPRPPNAPGNLGDIRDRLATNDWLLGFLEELGNLNLQEEKWVEAEKALRDAETILTTHFAGERLALLVAIQENGDIAARKLGKKIRPRIVGRFGHPNAIKIEGAKNITAKEIRSALLRSGGFVLSSHPGAKFEPFLKKLQRSLEDGYKKSGFPEVAVTVSWDEESDTVLAQIDEGRRYRMGGIQIEGAKVLAADVLREMLIEVEGTAKKQVSQAERTYRAIEKEKRLPEQVVKKVLEEKYPWMAEVKGADGSDPEEVEASSKDSFAELQNLFESDFDKDEEKPWTPGKWVDYHHGMGNLGRHFRKVYAAEGRLFPKFETEWILRKDEGIADVLVKITGEGPVMKLGTIHVVGNRVNTREELLDYLGLKKGMPIEGRFTDRLRRRFFDSGRFLAWEVITVPPNPFGSKSDELDLVLMVAEHWKVPPLSAELSREQNALKQFARWLNEDAMEKSDLVFSVQIERNLPVKQFECALGADGLSLDMDMRDHNRIRGVLTDDGEVDLLIKTAEKSFRIAVPTSFKRPNIFVRIHDSVESEYSLEIPHGSLKTHSINFGAGLGNFDGEIIVGIDPTTAVSSASDIGIDEISYDDAGQVTIEWGDWILKLEEASGRLVAGVAEHESPENGKVTLSVRSEKGLITKLRNELQNPGGKGLVDLEMGNPFSLAFAAIGSLVQLAEDENQKKGSFGVAGILERVGTGIESVKPLASAFGDFFGSMIKVDSDDEEDFTIPMDFDDMKLMQGGGNLSMFLALGGYDLLDQFVEPGTWPDRVLREAVFYLGGQKQYLNETVEDLLKDESVGPLGNLVCSALLQQMGHGAARSFLIRAEEELNEDGFAKDWRQFLRGKAGDEGPVWMLLEALKVLEDDQLSLILPKNGSDQRKVVDDLIAEVRAIDSTTEADSLEPIMARIWKQVEPEISPWLETEIDRLTPQINPAEVAATIRGRNGFHKVHRVMIPFTQAIIETRVALNWEEECLNDLLFAREMWRRGLAFPEEQVKLMTKNLQRNLTPAVRKKIRKFGLNDEQRNEQVENGVGVLMAAMEYKKELVAKSKISREEVKEFYDRRKDLFGAAMKRDVFVIRMMVDGNGDKERAELLDVVKQVKEMEAPQDKVVKFEELGGVILKKYLNYSPSDFGPQPSSVMKEMIQEGQILSDVFEEVYPGVRFMSLLMFPGDPRMGEPNALAEVGEKVRTNAIIDRESERLRRHTQIDRFEMPAPGVAVPNPLKNVESTETNPGVAQAVMEMWVGFVDSVTAIISPGVEEEKVEWGGTLKEYEEIQRKASEGSGKAIYYMGTYAERQLGEEKGMEVAVARYLDAAGKGEVKAMVRLAELYRIGRGTPIDKVKSLEWRKKAAEVQATQSE